MASFTTSGNSQVQAYEALRDLVRRVESGEVQILNMSIEQEPSDVRDFRSIDGGSQKMLVRNGDVRVELVLSIGNLARSFNPSEGRDEYGRLRGNTGIPRGATAGPKFVASPLDALSGMTGMTAAQRLAIEEEILRKSPLRGEKYPTPSPTPQEPVDPLRYGARKLDID